MSEIKPCPFCGNSEDLVIRGRVLSYIYCWNCGAEVQRMEAALKIFANPESWNDEGYSSYTEFPFAKGDPITIAKQALGESCKQPE